MQSVTYAIGVPIKDKGKKCSKAVCMRSELLIGRKSSL